MAQIYNTVLQPSCSSFPGKKPWEVDLGNGIKCHFAHFSKSGGEVVLTCIEAPSFDIAVQVKDLWKAIRFHYPEAALEYIHNWWVEALKNVGAIVETAKY